MNKLMVLAMSAVMALALPLQASAKDLKVGCVYNSPANEGYSLALDKGRQAIDALPNVETTFLENVKEGPDAERVFQNMARNNYDIIIGTTFGYMDPLLKVSKQFPKAHYFHLSSGFRTGERMTNLFARTYQPRYLTGMVAGGMTKSNIIGYVASYPVPEVLRNINAFTIGARSVNPKAEVRVVWTKSWYDPATEKEAAKSLMDVGADVMAQHQDSGAVQEAAQERGVWSLGWNVDMKELAPDVHLVASIWHWDVVFKMIEKGVRENTWKHGKYMLGIETGAVDITELSDKIPQALRDQVMQARADMMTGKLDTFAGPLKDQAGKERVAKGGTIDDTQIDKVDWFVEGVQGKLE